MNILLIASIANTRKRLDGEVIKNRTLRDYLEDQKDINLRTVDTDCYKKKQSE